MGTHLKLYQTLPIVAFLVASLLFASATQNASALPKLNVSVKVGKDPITVGNNQSVTVKVTSREDTPAGDASVSAEVVYASGSTRSFNGKTDGTGSWSFSWHIGAAAKTGTFTVKVTANKNGYEAGSGAASFNVEPYSNVPKSPDPKQPGASQKNGCAGKALCITAIVNKIIDGDTLQIGKYKVRLSLTDAPEKKDPDFKKAVSFTSKLCRVGAKATVDQDDIQQKDSYGRILGKVICSGKILNAELLYNGHAKIQTQFCKKSEFASESWAKAYGCK